MKIDSLLNNVKSVYNSDPERGLALAKLAYNYSLKGNSRLKEIKGLNYIVLIYLNKRDFKNSHMYANMALSVARDIKADSLAGDLWYLNGYIFHIENNFHDAIKNYREAVICYSKVHSEAELGKAFLSLGICENNLLKFESANLYYFKSADEFLKTNDLTDLSGTYNAIALCFFSLADTKKSLLYHQKALAIRLKLKDKTLIAQSYNNIGYLYKDKEPDSAIFYLSRCLEIRKAGKDSGRLVLTLQNLGYAWKRKGNYQKAESYVIRSLNIAAKYGMQEEIARGNLDLAELYTAQKKFNPAITAVKITQSTAKTLKLPELLMNTYADEAELYEQKGDYKAAVYYQREKDKLKDSMFSIAKDKAINELEIKYQTNLKEKNIIALNLQNRLQSKTVSEQRFSIIVLISGAVLLSLLFIIVYYSYRQKNKANIRIQHLMQELHHRVKNNLQILSGLFTMQLESLDDEAAKNTLRENETRLASMNLIHNKLYLNHGNSKIDMEDYLTKLLYHIKDSFDGGANNDIGLKIDAEPFMMEADRAVAVGLIVNELATNAFKYAFNGKTGEIHLSLKRHDKTKLLLNFSDNGKGISNAHKENEPSFGLKLVNLMARQLSSKLVAPNKGSTCYTLEIDI